MQEEKTDTVPISPPYDLQITVSANPQVAACPKIPAEPQKNLIFSNVYKRDDPYHAEIDESGKKKYTEQTKYIYRFETRLIEMSNKYLSTGNESFASCVMEWLYQWAAADAFLGNTNPQGQFVQQWGLASFSSAYLQIKNYAEKNPKKNETYAINSIYSTLQIKIE